MNKIIEEFFQRNNLNLSNETIVVAVSTGIDSMALLYTLNSLKEKISFKIVIAHVNHHKRNQSEEEEKYIKEYALSNNLECFVKEAYFENTSNFQMVAREVRYSFFYEIMAKVNSKYLFLAHHANDNMETILMRIIRGSNVKGYSGMEEVSYNKGITILRPFLSVPKKDLKEYAIDENIKYYDDESNFGFDYTRNRLRNEVIPLLEREDCNVYKKFEDFSKLIYRASVSFEKEVKEFIKENVQINEEIHFSLKAFLNLDEIFLNEVLFTLLKKYNLGKNNIIEIKKLIFSSKANLKQAYKGLFTFVKEYDDIYIFDSLIEDFTCDIKIDKEGTYQLNDKISICVSEKIDNSLINLNVLWYNSNMFPLTIRTRRPGDKIYIGNGYRKVKDVLIDEKIGILARDKVILATSSDGEILIIFGVKKSTKVKEINDCDVFIERREESE